MSKKKNRHSDGWDKASKLGELLVGIGTLLTGLVALIEMIIDAFS